MVLICSATLNRLEITTTNYKKKIPSDQNTENMKFDDALSAQCDGDVLPTKLKPLKI
jgi:hypothetical protein